MIAQPEKWKKYEILFKYTLATEAEINAQIRRYHKSDWDRLFLDIIDNMDRDSSASAYIIKLVPRVLRLKIDNYIVYNRKQLIEVSDCVHNKSDYEELWWCKTSISKGPCIHGRFYINSGVTTDVSQFIEQVWADTARKLEKIGDGTPYLSAQRLWWGRRYQIRNCKLSDMNSTVAKSQFREVVRLLEKHRYDINRFAQDAAMLDVCSLCLEYKIIDRKMCFVDWDSPNDKRILRGLL